jgi:hypothetical protein
MRTKQSEGHKKAPIDYSHSEDKIAKIKEARKGQDMTFRIPIEIKKQVIDLFDAGKFTKRQLSEKFGLKKNTICGIITKAKLIKS